MSRPRLLAVSPRFLFPLDQGGKIRTANILRRMKSGAFEIALASPVPADVARFEADIAALCDRFVSWAAPRGMRLRRLLALASRLPVAVATDRTRAGRRAVAAALANPPDLVLVDFPHAAVLLPQALASASAIFTHNVEAEIFERHAAVATGPWGRLWRIQARKMRAFEGAALRRFDTVIAVSERDAGALRAAYGLGVIERIDTGVDPEFYAFSPPGSAPPVPLQGGTIVFTGAMDWRANTDGIGFLMEEVWPIVLRARPRARALIVGRNPPESLIARARDRGLDWRFTGYVDDIRPLVAEAHVYVIPLRVGSGTRIKAFEAMAMGRPVVSTGVGVEGLDVVPGQHFLLADEAEVFAEAILRLLADAGLRARIATAARALVEARYSWTSVARGFEAICLRTLERRRA